MMKKILITGAGGFIGSHLAELCVRDGYQVRAFVHYNFQNSRGWLEKSEYASEIEFVAADVRDYDAVFSALKGCDTVFHLAALIGIPYSYLSPLAYIRTNVEGTYNVLQASREQQLEKVMITSTSETYGTAQYVPIDEKHPSVGQSPYAASKIAADQMALSYYRSFGLPVKIVRPFNTYGSPPGRSLRRSLHRSSTAGMNYGSATFPRQEILLMFRTRFLVFWRSRNPDSFWERRPISGRGRRFPSAIWPG
jgi:nucleoside-diphosphate-sugar epimerase